RGRSAMAWRGGRLRARTAGRGLSRGAARDLVTARRIEGLMSIFLRWGIPALVTVVGGTSLAISATAGAMSDDLAARTADALAAPAYGWAAVAFDARDAVLTGTAADQRMIAGALARVAAVHGVRSVRAEVVLAEHASPFPFSATVRNGAITLAGGVPDETAHAGIMLA